MYSPGAGAAPGTPLTAAARDDPATYLDAHPATDDPDLRLYALKKQAMFGDCVKAQPNMFNVVGRRKHAAWKTVLGTGRQEAQRRLAAALDAVAPGWRGDAASSNTLTPGDFAGVAAKAQLAAQAGAATPDRTARDAGGTAAASPAAPPAAEDGAGAVSNAAAMQIKGFSLKIKKSRSALRPREKAVGAPVRLWECTAQAQGRPRARR
jgi:acyl-CoA-binding protein